MGYLGFFYVEAKSFEIRSEIGVSCVRLVERSRGTIRLAEDFDGGVDKRRSFERVLLGLSCGKYNVYFAAASK
jgi:hypothetical protein